MKKIYGIICLVMILFCTNIQVFADASNPTLTVEKVQAEAGESVDVPIVISNNTGICGAEIQISYDNELTLTGIASGDAFSSMNLTKPGKLSANPVKLLWDGMDADCTNGTIAVLTFTAPEESGVYEVSAFIEDAAVVDGNLNPVELNIVNGSIEVIGQSGAATVASGYSGDTTWVLTDDGVLTFSGSGAMKNYTYKSEMPWYKYINDIKKVVLEDGITSIGNYAFYGMPNMTSITIPESVVSIGEYSFKNSTALDGVVLPSGLTQLGESAFYGCTSLTAIDIPASLYTVRPYTFKNCTSLAKVTFHEGNLQKLSDASFYGTALTEVVIPDCATIVDVYCFKNCSKLASVTLSSNMTQIREAVFYGTAIPTIEIPEGVTKIGPYAFKNCTKLTSVSLPTTLTSVGEASFYACTALKNLVLPDAVTTIGNYAFRKCEELASVTFSDELQTIGESSFYGCIGLTSLDIPENVTEIKGYAFKGCTGVTTVSLPDSLTTLGESAFYGCTGLGNVVIPVNVTTVGDYTFSRCSGLTSVQFVGNAPSIGSGAFSKVVATAYYPAENTTWDSTVMQNYGGTITWTVMEGKDDIESGVNLISSGTCGNNVEWSLNASNVLTISGSGEMTDYEDIKSVPWYSYCDQILKIQIEDGVTSVGKYAFYWCTSLEEVNISNSVTIIKESAFAGCASLKKVAIPCGVKEIEGYAFNSCTNLEELTFEEGVETIGANVFYGCAVTNVQLPASLHTLGVGALANCKNLTEIELNSVESIGAVAFGNCSGLVSVIIPESVTYIGSRAFDVGGYTLKHIYIMNSECEIELTEIGGIEKTLGWGGPGGVTIHGYEGSTAQTYAENYNRNFSVIL